MVNKSPAWTPTFHGPRLAVISRISLTCNANDFHSSLDHSPLRPPLSHPITMVSPHFTSPTTPYWQALLPASTPRPSTPYQYNYPALLPDSRILLLPIRALNGDEAVASLIINQASLDVVDELGRMLGEAVRGVDVDVVVGLPTLGLCLAPIVARALGHSIPFLLNFIGQMVDIVQPVMCR